MEEVGDTEGEKLYEEKVKGQCGKGGEGKNDEKEKRKWN